MYLRLIENTILDINFVVAWFRIIIDLLSRPSTIPLSFEHLTNIDINCLANNDMYYLLATYYYHHISSKILFFLTCISLQKDSNLQKKFAEKHL